MIRVRAINPQVKVERIDLDIATSSEDVDLSWKFISVCVSTDTPVLDGLPRETPLGCLIPVLGQCPT